MHNRPFHYWAWLDLSAQMFRALSALNRSYQARFVMNEALALRASAPYDPTASPTPRRGYGIPDDAIITLPQEAIREIFSAPNLGILEDLFHGRRSQAEIDQYSALLRGALGDFVPDVVITRTSTSLLAATFPDALILGTETGPFTRAPYPFTTFYDPQGLWGDSVPAVCAQALIARKATDSDRRMLDTFRDHYRPFFHGSSPFHALEAKMRRGHRRLALLPLQFGGESGFELNAPFRNQGEYLFHVLERLPAEVGLFVVEHPTAIWVGDRIDEETREYLRGAYPGVVFVDYNLIPNAGQFLVHHVDYVISISSSLGWQGLLWGKPLVSVGASHLSPYAAVQGMEALDDNTDPARLATHEGALAWLLRHYFPRDTYALHSGEWLDRFFRTGIRRWAEGVRGLEFFDPIDDAETVPGTLCAPLPGIPKASSQAFAEPLRNGRFDAWSKGNGPFDHGPTCDHWEVLGGSPGVTVERRTLDPESAATLEPLDSCARIQRSRPGEDPVLFLQRIPDLTRCAGNLLTLEFWARGDADRDFTTYLFLQTDHPGTASQGTAAQSHTLRSGWKRYRCTTRVPSVGAARLGRRNHTEVVFCLPPESGAMVLEVTGVELGQGVLVG